MEAALFWVIMVAVGWLVFWCCTDHTKPSDTWWPFDFRTSDSDASQADKQDAPSVLRRSRQNPTRPWKRFGS
jgi:lysylphosphatidylglycerol synthetase-like protein (DUF2156 family)